MLQTELCKQNYFQPVQFYLQILVSLSKETTRREWLTHNFQLFWNSFRRLLDSWFDLYVKWMYYPTQSVRKTTVHTTNSLPKSRWGMSCSRKRLLVVRFSLATITSAHFVCSVTGGYNTIDLSLLLCESYVPIGVLLCQFTFRCDWVYFFA